MHPLRQLLPPVLMLLVLVCVGTLGYILVEGWPFLDSIYMVIITLFTVGFSEVQALSPAGKVFTMFIILTGVGTAIYAGVNRDSENKLKMAGADRVISPYYISGTRMAAWVIRPVANDFFDMIMQ